MFPFAQVNGEPFINMCNRPARGVYVNNITCAHSHGLTIGSEVSGGIENVTITNVEVDHCDDAVRIKTKCGRGAYVRNIRYENITGTSMESAIWIDQRYSSGPKECDPKGTTIFSDIFVKNVVAEKITDGAYTIVGIQQVDSDNAALELTDAIQNVYLQNVTVRDYDSVGECTRANVTSVDLEPALPNCTHAKSIDKAPADVSASS